MAGAVFTTGELVLVRGPCQGPEITKETSRSDSGAHTCSQYQVASPWMFTEQAKLHLGVELETMAFKLECERQRPGGSGLGALSHLRGAGKGEP